MVCLYCTVLYCTVRCVHKHKEPHSQPDILTNNIETLIKTILPQRDSIFVSINPPSLPTLPSTLLLPRCYKLLNNTLTPHIFPRTLSSPPSSSPPTLLPSPSLYTQWLMTTRTALREHGRTVTGSGISSSCKWGSTQATTTASSSVSTCVDWCDAHWLTLTLHASLNHRNITHTHFLIHYALLDSISLNSTFCFVLLYFSKLHITLPCWHTTPK